METLKIVELIQKLKQLKNCEGTKILDINNLVIEWHINNSEPVITDNKLSEFIINSLYYYLNTKEK